MAWAASVVLQFRCMVWVARFGEARIRHREPLVDRLHVCIPAPSTRKVEKSVEVLLDVYPVAAMTVAMRAMWVDAAPRGRHTAEALLVSHALLLCMRAACFCSTLLPDASTKGKHPSALLPVSGGIHDLVFSGHMTFTLLMACATWHASPSGSAALVLCCVAQSYGILMLRKHYAVDVLLAWFLTPLVFFHTLSCGYSA